MQEFFDFIVQQGDKLAEQTLTHIGLTFLSLCLALLIGLPTGILITYRPKIAAVVLAVVGVLQTIPSIALLGFLIPILGIGSWPAIVALFLYALLPIVRNTYVGIREVSPALKETARGMGMTTRQVLTRLELPLALPVIFAGIRTATVINVGVATLAAYVAAGGLGEFIFGGIALNNPNMVLAGAIPAALLAVLFDFLLARLQHLRGLRLRRVALVFLLITPALSAFYWLPGGISGGLMVGFAHEFYGRADGYPGLARTYGLRVTPRLIDQNLMYEAIYRGQVDLISGYSTDGRIKAFDLRVLDDNKNAFPPYEAALVVRQAVLNQYPELSKTLHLLDGRLSDAVMTELNYRADFRHESPEAVARRFLTEQKLLLPPTRKQRQGRIVIGTKIFTEQYILAEILRQLLDNRTTLEVVTKTGLGGTQICFNALTTGQIDLYPEYTGTGLLVILQPPPALADSLKADREAVYRYVSREFQSRYKVSWLAPMGFNNTYALMMRRAQADRLGIRSISDLKRYLGDKD
ncbi:osmoprotectant transport system permease protein [Larkinella arboricola]|uniref:Osmoprotectant transport system permease protein n=1 Tax=Larkinella arboricola TaxID=643671 RepID=A0A327WZ24_LARAB|nr:ABC transporter permease/substrate-binding protein [Larkinella arboricola]RAJ97800.1 osmoprotectant transport system permease protein [Larkinella arboricola]